MTATTRVDDQIHPYGSIPSLMRCPGLETRIQVCVLPPLSVRVVAADAVLHEPRDLPPAHGRGFSLRRTRHRAARGVSPDAFLAPRINPGTTAVAQDGPPRVRIQECLGHGVTVS